MTAPEIDLWLQKLELGLSPEQAAPVYDCEHDVVDVAGGVGAGKSFIASLFGTVRIPYSPLIWVVGPDYKLTEREFAEFVRFLSKLDLVESINDPMHGPKRLVHRLGGTIETFTSNDLKKIAARGPTGIILTEPAQQDPEVFYRCLERLSRSEHPEFFSWLLLAGTFEESAPWFDQLWEELQGANPYNGKAYSLPTWANAWRFPGGYDDPDLEKVRATMPSDRFEARYGAHPVKPAGLVLPEFDIKRHVDHKIRFDSKRPVELWVDTGWSGSHYAVEVVQFYDEQPRVRVVDEIYVQYATNEDVIKIAQARPWWKNVASGVADIATIQHTNAARSPQEVWQAAGIPLRTKFIKVQDGVDRHRGFLLPDKDGHLQIQFSPNCQGAKREYALWKRKKDNVLGLFLSEPDKKNCDALKAISYGLVDRFGLVNARRRAPVKKAKRWR